MALASPFAHFVDDLLRRHGSDAVAQRHELFFQAAKPLAAVRGRWALLRDARLLARPVSSPPLATTRPLAVLVATLGGSNGWGTLVRALPSIVAAGLEPVVLAHPRLADTVFPPALPVLRPGGGGWYGGGWYGDVLAGLRGWVAAAAARRRLWRRAVAATLAGRRGVLVLHNDFDMMSTACLDSGWPSVCLQHGAPTDEFFPGRADHQLVWGESSAAAYAAAGTDPARLVVDALGRAGARCPDPGQGPQELAVVSQSAAAVFGPALPGLLAALVAALRAARPDLLVLLHPVERGRHPYGPAVRISLPPHALLEAPAPWLVLAYCSTMAIDAAAAGHWVAAIDFPLAGNVAARAVAVPPLRAKNADEAIALWRRLADDESFRQQAAREQQAWLEATFSAEPGGLCRLLRQIVPPCPSP